MTYFNKYFLKRIGAVILLGICNLIELLLKLLLQLPRHQFFVIMCLVIYVGYTSTTRHRFMNNRVLSRITQTEFPDFTVLKYEKGQKSFTGDYRGSIVFKLKEPLSEEFIQSIKDLSSISDQIVIGACQKTLMYIIVYGVWIGLHLQEKVKMRR